MAVKHTRLTHKTAIQLHLVGESCTICISRFRRPVRKLLDKPSNKLFLFLLTLNGKAMLQKSSQHLHYELISTARNFSTLQYWLLFTVKSDPTGVENAFVSGKVSSRGKPTWSDSPAWGLGERLTTLHRQTKLVTKYYTGPVNWRDLVKTVTSIRIP
jgi:hypothetical protein